MSGDIHRHDWSGWHNNVRLVSVWCGEEGSLVEEREGEEVGETSLGGTEMPRRDNVLTHQVTQPWLCANN